MPQVGQARRDKSLGKKPEIEGRLFMTQKKTPSKHKGVRGESREKRKKKEKPAKGGEKQKLFRTKRRGEKGTHPWGTVFPFAPGLKTGGGETLTTKNLPAKGGASIRSFPLGTKRKGLKKHRTNKQDDRVFF